MATTEPIAFHGRTYKTKIAATTALREFVSHIPLRVWLHPGEDTYEDLLDVLEHHQSWGDRLGEIVKLRFERETPSGIACRVVLADGTTDKLSWTKTFSAERTDYAKVLLALRYEVRDQSQELRQRIADGVVPAVCALTKQPLLPNYEVDHYAPTFTDLASDWLSEHGGYENVAVHRLQGGGTEMTDDDLADDWWEYHRKHAKLRAVNAEVHKRRTRRQRKANR